MNEAGLGTTLLQLLKHREHYAALAQAVPVTALDEKTKILLADFGKFLREFPDVTRIDYDAFMLWFKGFAHPTLSTEKQGLFAELLKPMLTQECPESLRGGILLRLAEADLARRTTDWVTRYEEGQEIELGAVLRAELERYEERAGRDLDIPEVTEDISDIMRDDLDNRGLRWRLKCLNDHMRPLRGGDSIIWAGRPGRGKTSSLLGEVTYMAPQFDDYYGEERYLLWFNNEGPGRRIKKRAYNAALNATTLELLEMQRIGTLQNAYDAAMGAPGRLIVVDIHGRSTADVENICKKRKPGLIVFDMIDKINFTGALANKGERTDQVLESMYDWGRDLGVYHGCPVIPTSQTSGAAANKPFPTDDMLKDSKTGKQGACDGIVMQGMTEDAGYPNSRFISIVKTKMGIEGMPDSPNLEVTLDQDRSRLVMPLDE
ncbi:AAA family ATPase [Robbsia andropogonis]|uniref:AAA family ATPase n=1 Tax=Robbsia andropogonis TaxID=28092 RepID=UPI002A6AE1FC|nr:AAA family ATPase [Robbsia andropogonis]